MPRIVNNSKVHMVVLIYASRGEAHKPLPAVSLPLHFLATGIGVRSSDGENENLYLVSISLPRYSRRAVTKFQHKAYVPRRQSARTH